MILSKLFKKVFLTESKQFQKTVALVGGSYKFPTIAHWYMIEQYVDKADEVVILISDPKNPKSIRKTSNGTIITAQMAKDIFDIYINRYGFQNKVKAIISPEPSPITALFKYIDNNLSDVNVILGVSKKGGDEARFKSAEKYYADNEHINLINPIETAVEPYIGKNGQPISATDARNNIENIDLIKEYLPSKLTEEDIKEVLSILGVNNLGESLAEQYKPLDETEEVHFDITDEDLSNCKLYAYNTGMITKDDKGKTIPITPKKFPTKAIDIVFPKQELLVEVYLDAKTKKWDSKIDVGIEGQYFKLSPDQMEQFFCSKFYEMLKAKLQNSWPISSDELYSSLYEGIENKEMQILSDDETISEDEDDEEEKKTYTASGRKIVNFSDMQVKHEGAKFFCWPNKDKLFNWSTWKSAKKIKPFCRLRFGHGKHIYGISLSPVFHDYKNRGFKGYCIDLLPHLQWLTKEEMDSIMKLSIVRKFIKYCIEKVDEALKHSPEEIYEKINNPEKITIDEIRATQDILRRTLNKTLKKHKVDTFKWS